MKDFSEGVVYVACGYVCLPFFSAEGYSIIKHTTSELGAQHTVNSRIMNATFIGLGILCITEAIFNLNSFRRHQIILILFSIGLLLSGLFSICLFIDNFPIVSEKMNFIVLNQAWWACPSQCLRFPLFLF